MSMLNPTRLASLSGAAVLGVGAFWTAPFDSSRNLPTAIVTRRPFTETLVESGTVSAARMMVYAAPVGSGQSKIVELTQEGTSVSAGDVLVRFDVSLVELAIQKEEALLRRSEAELLSAQEQLRLERLAATSDVDDARQEVEFKQRQSASERDGRGRLALEEARAAEGEARREEARTRTAHEDVRSLLAEGFATRAEVQRAEQAHRRAEESLRLASLKLELQERFDRPAAVEHALASLRAAERGLTQSRDRAAARVAQHDAGVAIAASAVDAARARLGALREQAEHSVIRAAAAGIVVHRDLFFGSDRRKPQVGDEVWPNQPLVALPESSSLIVETRVREVDLHRVSLGTRVLAWLDAFPDLKLTGSVSLVGAVAQDDPTRAGTRYFPMTIKLDESDPRLRTGMTARVEIEAASIALALVVPVDAISEDDGGAFCVVVDGSRQTRRSVRVLGRSGSHAAIEGLEPGNAVLRGAGTANE